MASQCGNSLVPPNALINTILYLFQANQKSANDSSLADMILPIFIVVWAFTLIFAYCELGKMVTNQFNTINEELYRCKWYLLSLEMQRMLLIFMSDTQQPMFLRGYANIVCTRDSFKNVCTCRAFSQAIFILECETVDIDGYTALVLSKHFQKIVFTRSQK